LWVQGLRRGGRGGRGDGLGELRERCWLRLRGSRVLLVGGKERPILAMGGD
jgi:hypothetical protein